MFILDFAFAAWRFQRRRVELLYTLLYNDDTPGMV